MKTVIYGNGSVARLLHAYARDHLQVAGFTVDDCQIGTDTAQLCGLPLVRPDQITA